MSNVNDNCKVAFVNLAQDTKFTGQQFCTDIFATKLFVAKQCDNDCQKPSGSKLATINCNPIRALGDTIKPENIAFQFQCTYDGVLTPCLSREYNFQQVQQYFKDNCIENVSSTPSSETSSGMTSISSSNAITSSDQSTGHGHTGVGHNTGSSEFSPSSTGPTTVAQG